MNVFVLKHIGDIGELQAVVIKKAKKVIKDDWYLDSVAVKRVHKWLPPKHQEKRWEISVENWIKEESVRFEVKK